MTACVVTQEVIWLSSSKLKLKAASAPGSETATKTAMVLPHRYDPTASTSSSALSSANAHRRKEGAKPASRSLRQVWEGAGGNVENGAKWCCV